MNNMVAIIIVIVVVGIVLAIWATRKKPGKPTSGGGDMPLNTPNKQ